ncbi:STAS domain-containing protein [Mucilaginibacter sp. SMC90]|uniref:STAS domain-containing protein n=1 Tax=Mucilaginibacter sp. SMC90 TaxID=2929803 RepID=UPI001FB2CF16|nr:STAS domain-containing protein [Mucilaginibacter sp. SMC90]UOE52120.1 STAS domain-containing protein [Mucilaginibacter sp. SMC90]
MILQTHLLDNALIADIQLKEANLANSEQFKSELISLVNNGNKFIIVNFEQVIYVDSSFLGALVSALKLAMNNGADIAVVGLNSDIKSLFQLVRLDKVFKIYTNTQEALTGA